MTTWCCSCHQFGTAGNVTIAAPYAVAGTQVAAALLDVQWPTARWPVYVFLAGAMACLLTSAMCHLLACCSFEAGSAAAELEPPGFVQCSSGGSVKICDALVFSFAGQSVHLAAGLRR